MYSETTLWASSGDYQNCSVLYCVLKLCTVISTLRWAVLTVLWIGFCHTGPISLCVDLFVFICVCFVCFCFILHSCCIIVSVVGWTGWDWSLILRTYLPSLLWHCWLVIWPVKPVPDMTFNVFGGPLRHALYIYGSPGRPRSYACDSSSFVTDIWRANLGLIIIIIIIRTLRPSAMQQLQPSCAELIDFIELLL